MRNIEEEVKKLLARQLGDWGQINNGMLLSYLELDAIDEAELVRQLEEEFGVEIPDDAFRRWVRVQDVIDWVTPAYR